MEEMFSDYQCKPKKLIHFGSNQPIKEAVQAGLGISLLSRWAIQRELENQDLRIIPVESLPFIRQFSIITNSAFKTKALDVFIDLLKNHEMLKRIHD